MYDEGYPTCSATYATLRIFDVAPEVVTQRLGVQPSQTGKQGEHWKTRFGLSSVPYRRDCWFLCTKDHVDSKDVRRHVDWLLEQLVPCSDELLQFQAEGAPSDIFCYWLSKGGHGGPSLGPDTMRRLADLRLEISFDVYLDESNE